MRTMDEEARLLSMNNCGVHGSKYRNHTIHTDMATELMEEEEAVTMRPEAWLTEVKLQLANDNLLTKGERRKRLHDRCV